MEAGKRTIALIFNKGRALVIPFFQRSYVWGTENWERFISDMLAISEYNKDYFMGSLILKSQLVTSEKGIGDWRIVVDGQQRLTTIILFFKVICSLQNNDSLFKDAFYNWDKEIILKHNHNDIDVFEAIVTNNLTDELKDKYKNNNILKCYNYFEQDSTLKTINVNNILNKLYFVGIDLGSEEDEQQIFDTINSLGVSLTTAELLKNELFRREDKDLYSRTWKEAFEKDEDTKDYWDQRVTSGRQFRVNIDLLLQSYLLIHSEANNKYIKLNSLFNNYKSFLKDNNPDKQEFIRSLIKYSHIYQQNINPDFLNQDIDINSNIERLNLVIFGLNMTTIIPYALYLLKEVENSNERNKMFNLLECYLIRRIICKETTKNYNNIFASFIRNKINTYEKLYEKIYNAEDPSNKMPDNEDLKKGFIESNLTNQQAKTVLYLIEKSIRSTKHSTNLRPLNEYSLEHIMPKKWQNNWNDKHTEEEINYRNKLVLKLGNLTIITASLNSSIRDASWEIKKNGKGSKKGLKEYSAGIRIFKKYLENDSVWNNEEFIKRGNELYNHSVNKVWNSETE